MTALKIYLRGSMATVMNGVQWVITGINQYLSVTPPVQMIAVTILAWTSLQNLNKLRDERTRDWLWQRISHRLLQVPQLRQIFHAKLAAQCAASAESFKKKWAPFGEPIRKIPDEGVDFSELMGLIRKYHKITMDGLKGKQFSGTIYSSGLDQPQFAEALAGEYIAEDLEALFTSAFRCAYLWNTLHTTEFPIGSFLEYQVVQMVSEAFGGDKNVAGVVTSGGTESIMTAAKGYRNWGLERGIAPGETVIIAPDSIHASLQKAADDYHIRLILIPTNEMGVVDMEAMHDAIIKHRSNLVALFASAPSYPKGKIDPISDIGILASEYGVGCHVDCCLGGFVLKQNFLNLLGITSLSADTHKNGWAPKGSSVLVTKEVPEGQNLSYYSTYAIPGWTGGVYGTVKSAGSQSVLPAFHAFLAMMAIGQKGYNEISESILKAANHMAGIIKSIPGLRLLGEPDLNVVAFKVDPALGLMPGASYAFAKEMSDRGFVLNALRGDSVHFCITGRFVGNEQNLTKFEEAARESLEAVQKLNGALIQKGQKFPGDAGMYCELEAAMAPKREAQGLLKYFENSLFGGIGAMAAVKTYLVAMLNPWAPTRFALAGGGPQSLHEE